MDMKADNPRLLLNTEDDDEEYEDVTDESNETFSDESYEN